MWSLAIEEQFYLLWPLLIAPLIRTRRAIPYLIVAYVVVTAWRCSFTDLRAMYDHFDSHCTGLILGCLLYFISYRPSRLAFYSGCGAVGVLLLSAPYGPLIPTSLAITAAELAAFVVISGAVVFAPPLLISAPMVRIGKLSYGIYLWHAPIAFALREQPSFLAFIASFGIATIAAAISYTTIEVWARRQRDLTSKNPDLAPRHVARRA
jgi:peptidoglycan/LPS O-acetylase OafA/YrhL